MSYENAGNAKILKLLNGDAWREIFGFLLPSDACRITRVAKSFQQKLEDEQIWLKLMAWSNAPQLVRELLDQQLLIGEKRKPTCADLRAVARLVEGCSDMSLVSWDLLDFERQSCRIPAMEAHAAVTIVDRYVAVVGGWGASDGNCVYVIDGASLSFPSPSASRALRRVPCATRTLPRFRYGFSATVMDGIAVSDAPWLAATAKLPVEGETSLSKRILVFGGVLSGGYTFDCNDLYALVSGGG